MTEDIVVEQEVKAELTVGEMLRQARTTGRRKREISTIAKQLCIREEFLTALEEGNYTIIPETIYILGFARNYAMELGLNPDEIVLKIKQELGMVNGACASTGDVADEEGPTCAMPSIKEEKHFQKTMEKAWKFVVRNWIWFVGALVAVILLVVGIVLIGATEKEVKELAPTAVTAPVAQVAEPAYTTAVRERFGTENRESAKVILQAAQESWVKVEDGRGNTVFSRVLVPGDVYYVPNGDKYKATFGNAGGIDIWVDGVQVPDAGPDHTRKSGISLSPESLVASK